MNTAALVSAALDLRRAQRRHAPSGEVLMLHTAFEEAADAVLDDEAAEHRPTAGSRADPGAPGPAVLRRCVG